MKSPILTRLTLEASQSFAESMQRAFEAGIKVGQERERKTLIDALKNGMAPVSVAADIPRARILPAPKKVVQEAKTATANEYGLISTLARSALMDIAESKSVSIQNIVDWCNNAPGGEAISSEQIRSTLKVLVRNGYAARAERGKYRATARLLAD